AAPASASCRNAPPTTTCRCVPRSCWQYILPAVDARVRIGIGARWLVGVRVADAGQVADAVMVGGMQHRQRVVNKQRRARRKRMVLLQRLPEAGSFLRRTIVVAGDDLVEIGADAAAIQLHAERPAVRVGGEDHGATG